MRVACISTLAAIAAANTGAEVTCAQQLKSSKDAIKHLENTVAMITKEIPASTYTSAGQVEKIFKDSYAIFSGIATAAYSELKAVPAVAPHAATVEGYISEGVSAYKSSVAPVVNNIYTTATRELSKVYTSVTDIPAVADVKSLIVGKLGLALETAEVVVNTAFTKLATGAPDIAHLLPESFFDRLLFIFALVVAFKYTVRLPWAVARKVLCVLTLGRCSKSRCCTKTAVQKKKIAAPAPRDTVDTASVASNPKSEVRKRK